MSKAYWAVPMIRRCMSYARRQRLMTVIAATAATFAIWLIAHPIVGINLETARRANEQSSTIGSLNVVFVTTIAGLVGWTSLAILERMTARARTIWTACATVMLLVSLLGPLSAATTGATITLFSMHLAAGIVLISGLRNS
jgi:Family of unknown function (DUF6069)